MCSALHDTLDSMMAHAFSAICMCPLTLCMLGADRCCVATCLHAAQVFDERTVRYLYSSDWKEREQGLRSVARTISSAKFTASQDPAAAFQVTVQIAGRSLM